MKRKKRTQRTQRWLRPQPNSRKERIHHEGHEGHEGRRSRASNWERRRPACIFTGNKPEEESGSGSGSGSGSVKEDSQESLRKDNILIVSIAEMSKRGSSSLRPSEPLRALRLISSLLLWVAGGARAAVLCASACPLVYFVALLGGCDRGVHSDKVEFRVPVSVKKVGTGSVEDRIIATGTLRAAEVISLQVETGGTLKIARNASGRRLGEGDHVKVGQVIAEITGEDVRLAAHTDATRQRYEAARAEYEALTKLHAQGTISKADLSDVHATMEDAKLEYDRSVHSEKRNRLVATIDGVILRLARDSQGQPFASGQLVTTGFEIAQIAPTEKLIAEVDVVGPDVARVAVGLPVRVRHYAWESQNFSGTVMRLAPMIDPVTRALRAEVEVENDAGRLRPGMFVEVTIIGQRREGVPVVPREAVTSRGGKWVVFVLNGQKVSSRTVVLGLGDDEIVEIREGLETGERVVVRGLETLTDQTRVRVTGS